MKEKLLEIFADVLEEDQNNLKLDLNKDEYENWDSIAHLTLVADVEAEFSVSFTPEEIEKLVSIESFLDLIQSK